METIKNILVIVASIAVIAYVGDSLTTKYQADETMLTCTSPEVEDLLLDVVTSDVKQELKKEHIGLNTSVIRKNTSTEERIPTIGNKSKLKCNTSIQVELTALDNDQRTQKFINNLDKDKSFTFDRDYTVTENDLGTYYWVNSNKVTYYDISSKIE